MIAMWPFGKLLNFSEPPVPICKIRNYDSYHERLLIFMWYLWTLLLEYLAHIKHMTNYIPSFHCIESIGMEPLPLILHVSSQLVCESLTSSLTAYLPVAGILQTCHSISKSISDSFSPEMYLLWRILHIIHVKKLAGTW